MKKGFSLIEVMIALCILMVSAMAFFRMHMVCTQARAYADCLTRATVLGSSRMLHLDSLPATAPDLTEEWHQDPVYFIRVLMQIHVEHPLRKRHGAHVAEGGHAQQAEQQHPGEQQPKEQSLVGQLPPTLTDLRRPLTWASSTTHPAGMVKASLPKFSPSWSTWTSSLSRRLPSL